MRESEAMGDNEKAAWQEGGGVRKNDRRMVEVTALAGYGKHNHYDNVAILNGVR